MTNRTNTNEREYGFILYDTKRTEVRSLVGVALWGLIRWWYSSNSLKFDSYRTNRLLFVRRSGPAGLHSLIISPNSLSFGRFVRWRSLCQSRRHGRRSAVVRVIAYRGSSPDILDPSSSIKIKAAQGHSHVLSLWKITEGTGEMVCG